VGDKLYRVPGAAEKVGLHEATLRRYEDEGLIVPIRDETGCRL
jgi:DNA-binding transcriptional MerR regulator